MATYKSEELEKEAIRNAAAIMAASARTAPKAGGIDYIKTAIVDGDDILKLAAAMEEKAGEHVPPMSHAFTREAEILRKCSAVLLIGITGLPKIEIDCGACGYKTCQELVAARTREGKDFSGPNCLHTTIDLGVALGSAVKVASILNIDNRVQYTVGAAAKKLRLLDADMIIGVPLSVTGKNPCFDAMEAGAYQQAKM
jgi:uncharacterized ferredoxin-like protein